MRDVAAHAVQHQQRSIGIGAANVDVLAEDGELLGQIAVQRRQLVKTRLVVNALLVPLLERVGATAHHGNVELVGAFDQRITNGSQLTQHFGGAAADAGGDFDHAARHLGHHAAGQLVFAHQAQHVGGVRGQIVVIGVDQLQLQLYAQRQRLGVLKGFQRHFQSPC